MLGVVLLYVGAVLVINGIWLIGQARVASAGEAGATEAESHPFFIQGREVAVINIFTGFVGVVAAVTLMVHGNRDDDIDSIRGGGFILLFAFTYLWVAANGNDASIYLAIDWFAWAVLWFLFFVLLALDRPIARIAGGLAILEGIGTAWVFGLLLLLEQMAF